MARLVAVLVLLAVPAARAGGHRLGGEPSPFLAERAADPIEWLAWGEEAFERARREDKPVFLTIGHAACHRCRVRARKLFADPETAELLSRAYVGVAVDGDERPDVAEAYALALAVLSEGGGEGGAEWLSVFLTAEGRPFYGRAEVGREEARARPALKSLLQRFAVAYRESRGELEAKAGAAIAILREAQGGEAPRGPLARDVVDSALRGLAQSFDSSRGGFGFAPKAPPHGALRLLLEEHARTGSPDALRMATRTLDAMARGGIRDHVGGGFHRETVDGEWRFPRFEKTLADNALLLRSYARAHAATGSGAYAEVARGIAAWALREMRDPGGGFRSSLDAASDGIEGTLHLWTRDELLAALGADRGAAFLEVYRLDPPGILSFGVGLRPGLSRELETLLERRSSRPPPAADERVVAAWNGLMIGALATSGSLLARKEEIEAARLVASEVLARLGPSGSLRRLARGTETRGPAFLDDYAYLAEGLLDLHDATKERRWLDEAAALADAATAKLLAGADAGFFQGEPSRGPAPARLKDAYDGRFPSANGVMASVLLRLGRATGERRYAELGRRTVEAFLGELQRAPSGMETLVAAAEELLPNLGPTRTAGPLPSREVRGPVTVEASLSRSSVRTGEPFEARVRLLIDPGWHVNDRSSARGLVPTTVSVPTASLLAGAARYPGATPYMGDVTVAVPLRVRPGAAAGSALVRLSVRFQPCQGRDCRAPESVVLEVPLTVAAAPRR